MSYESTAEPIKIGYLMDFLLGDYPKEIYEDLTIPFDMVFQDAFDKGLIDRRVEIVYREVEGLPKGTVKNVIDAYEELVDGGLSAGIRAEYRGQHRCGQGGDRGALRVPAISVTGSDLALGEWIFAFPMGSHYDEPIFWTDLLVKRNLNDVGILMEASLVGESYVDQFPKSLRTARVFGSSVSRRLRRLRKTSVGLCGTFAKQTPRLSFTQASASVWSS